MNSSVPAWGDQRARAQSVIDFEDSPGVAEQVARDLLAALDELKRLRQALTKIAGHQVLSGEHDDPCDWHCTRQLSDIAWAVLNVEASVESREGGNG